MKIVADLSLTSAPHRARQGWHPGMLFDTGAGGAWFDPSDITSLFQDSAGTLSVTGPNQPVGRMLDKSGNGHHATQPVSSARPIYRADGLRHWLEFDGVDDRMGLVLPVDIDTGTVVMGLMEPAGIPSRAILISPSAAGYITTDGSGNARSLGKNQSGVIRPVNTPSLFPMTAPAAVGIRVAGERIFARRWPDPVEHFNADEAVANLQGTDTLMAFASAGQLPARVDLYGLLLCSEALPAGTYARALSHMHQRIAP